MASLIKEQSVLKYEIQKGTHLDTSKYKLLALSMCNVMYVFYHMLDKYDTFYKYAKNTPNVKVTIILAAA